MPPTSPRPRRAALPLLHAALLLAACNGAPGAEGAQRAPGAPEAPGARPAAAAADTLGIVPAARQIPTRHREELVEASTAVMSIAQPGIVFTVNDSRHEPLLFAVDTTGADRGAWRVTGARNRDWETAVLGPCGAEGDAGAPAAGPPGCLYIGDVGDNLRGYASVTLYRVREPAAATAGHTGAVPAERLDFRYATGAHDVEAMTVGADGTMHFITKRPLTDARGARRPALVFALPAAAWREPAGLQVAALVDSLPIVPGTAIGRQVTDAALSPDGRWVAVRTYSQVYVFAAEPRTGRIRTAVAPTVCDVLPLGERQGEGITWLGDTGHLLLTSEGRREPLRVIDCPRPRA